MQLGKRIIHYRNKLNMSTRKLALIIGISPGYLADIEKGDKIPSLEMLEKIRTSLNIPIKELFDDDQTAEPLTPELKHSLKPQKSCLPINLNNLPDFWIISTNDAVPFI